MIEYLYILDYTLKAQSECLHIISDDWTPIDTNRLRKLLSHQLVHNASLYGMGEKYGIQGLKGIVSEKFAAILQRPVYVIDGEKVSMTDTKALGKAIKCIYDTTPESDKGLRDQVLRCVKRRLKLLLSMEEFKAVLAEVPDFSYQLLVQEAASRHVEEHVAKKRKTSEGKGN